MQTTHVHAVSHDCSASVWIDGIAVTRGRIPYDGKTPLTIVVIIRAFQCTLSFIIFQPLIYFHPPRGAKHSKTLILPM